MRIILATLLATGFVASFTPEVEAQVRTPDNRASTTRGNGSPLQQDYQLGPGDKLRIEVYQEPQLSQSLQIRPDGKITLPFVGDLAASGFTPLELRDAVTEALKEYVTNPVVTVIVVEALASNVYVMGQVNSPGPVQLRGPLTVMQALAMAGGFGEWANTRDIRILRRGPRGVTTIRFNYREAMNGSDQPVYLQPGDTVIVP